MALVAEEQSPSTNLVQYERLNRYEVEVTKHLHRKIKELLDYLKANRQSYSTNGPVAVMGGVRGNFRLSTDYRGKVTNSLLHVHRPLIQLSITVSHGRAKKHGLVFSNLKTGEPFYSVEVDDPGELDVGQLFKALCLGPMS